MLKLAALFGDNAVLQQGKTIPVRGFAEPCSMIKGKLGDTETETRTGDDGSFTLFFPAMTACRNQQLFVLNETSGESLSSRNLAVGEVWLAGGQSNMEFRVRDLADAGASLRHRAGLGELDQVRMITVAHNAHWGGLRDISDAWQLPAPETVDEWSAVALYFALKLAHDLNVPVGVISSNWGGTTAEAWSSREALAANPDYAGVLEKIELKMSSSSYWSKFTREELADPALGQYNPNQVQQTLAESLPPEPPDTGFEAGWAKTSFDDSGWEEAVMPERWGGFGLVTNGTVYFRRQVEIPAEWENLPLTLSLGSVDKHDITYFDGVPVGRTGSNFDSSFWDVCRVYRIAPELAKPGVRVIAVRDYSYIYDGGLRGPARKMLLYPEGMEDQAIPLSGEWKYQVEHDLGLASAADEPGVGSPKTPSILFENMIAPLLPTALRGVIWYQGESNVDAADRYAKLMASLIEDWRRWFRQGDIPFLQVLLAGYHTAQNYDPDASWPYLREAQLEAARMTGNGIASAVDVGDADDIHPKDKKTVGERLAAAALAQCYGSDEEGAGPILRSYEKEGSKLRLSFDHAAGLYAKEDDSRGFRIAGADGTFVPAEAEIRGEHVILQADGVPEPVHARYAWSDNPESANLYNSAGLPMLPFRTDS